MTEPERTEREQAYRGPLPGEVPLSRDSRAGGAVGRSLGAPGGPGAPHVPDRATSRAQRRTDGRAMVPLLARALASQLAQLVAEDDAAPDGWWFTPEDR